MTLKRRSTVDGHTDLRRSAVVDISVAVNGHRGWKTVCFATEGSAVKSWTAAAIVRLIFDEETENTRERETKGMESRI